MPIVEPGQNRFEAEHRAMYQPMPHAAHVGVIVQGTVTMEFNDLKGDPDDGFPLEYEVRLHVGPFWKGDVISVVPSVTINGFYSSSPDEDDYLSWRIKNLTWDTVGEFGPNNDEVRIRLKFIVEIRGEHSQVRELGYYLLASSRELGVGGLDAPGPVKGQGQP